MEFKNVTVVDKANIYFDGKVSSRTIIMPNGNKKTLGVMTAGEYVFNTDEEEFFEIISGKIKIMLGNSNDYSAYSAGDSFVIPAKSAFKAKIDSYVDYCCSYKPC